MAVKAHTMCVARDPATGAVLLSATVNVYTPGTVTPVPATMYDKSGGTLSNPLTSDPSTGLIDFYMTVAQEVDLSVAKAGYTTRTYSNVPVLDDATFELSALLTTTGDMAYASAANIPARLPIAATANAVMAANGGVPAWSTTLTNPAAGGLGLSTGALTVSSTATNASYLTNAAAGNQNTLTLRAGGTLVSDYAVLQFANFAGTQTGYIQSSGTGSLLQIVGTTEVDINPAGVSNLRLGNATLGFFGGTPVVKQAAAANGTDAATTQALANNLKAILQTYGMVT